MRRRNLWLALLLLALFSCRREEELTLLQRLQRIPGVTATASEPLPCYAQAFQVDVTQPVDHTQAGRGEFRQRLYLSYRGEAAPTVFYTSGYGISRNYESEPAALLQANQVLMVHRYFPDAVPSANDWSFLTTALQPDPGLDAVYVVQPGANHGVKIKNLDRKGEVIAALER